MAREPIILSDFSGGLDLVNDIVRMPENRVPYAKNFRATPAGTLEALPGYGSSKGSLSYARDLFWFEKADGSTQRLVYTQKGTGSNGKWSTWTPHASGLGSGSYADIRTGLTAVEETTFAIHNDLLYGLDSQNNMATWDGTTLNSYAPGVDSAPALGQILGIWEGKMWVAKANSMVVVWSDVADPTNGFVNTTGMWPADQTVTLGGSGSASERIVGGAVTPDGLTVFTTDGIYLIYDSTDGFNTLVDSQHGCRGRRSIQQQDDAIYFLSERGIFKTNGRLPATDAAPQIAPYFELQGALSSASMPPCAVIFDGSYWVAFNPNDSNASGYNRAMFELNLTTGSVMWHTLNATARAFAVGRLGSSIQPSAFYIGTGSGASDGSTLYEAFAGVNGWNGAAAEVMLPYAQQDAVGYRRLHEVVVRAEAPADGVDIAFAAATDYELLTSAGSGRFGSDDLSTPTYGVEWERRNLRVGGVTGQTISGLLTLDGVTATMASTASNPLPVGTTSRDRIAVISSVELWVSKSSKRRPV